MLEVKNLTLRAGNFLLDNISVSVEDSQCHVVVGPTGCGKSILLETIMGFRKPAKGEVWLNRREIARLPTETRGISYLPQDLAIFPHLNVRENIHYGVKMKKGHDGHAYDLCNDLVDTMGIGNLLDRSTRHLSGGERQRVGLVRALAPGHKCIILDEPFSALHESMKRELWYLLKRLQHKYGLTVLVVTHDMDEAFFLGDSLSIMIGGKIHQAGKRRDIYRCPCSVDVAEFLGIRNLFEACTREVTGSGLFLYCQDLNATLCVSEADGPSIREEKEFIVGIRSEELTILRSHDQTRGIDNVLNGKVMGIFEKGASHTVLFLPHGSRRNIEIEVPDYAYQGLNLFEGKSILVLLRGDSLFFLKKRGFEGQIGQKSSDLLL